MDYTEPSRDTQGRDIMMGRIQQLTGCNGEKRVYVGSRAMLNDRLMQG